MKIIVGFCFFLISSMANAEGLFDFADPCKKAEKDFKSSSASLRDGANKTLEAWENAKEPTPELRAYYTEAFRKSAFEVWKKDPTAAELIKALSASDKKFNAYNYFISTIYPKKVTKESETAAVNQVFLVDKEATILPEIRDQKKELENQIADQKKELDGACQPDVVSQLFRATLGNALIIIDRNKEAAKNEDGDIAKLVRSISGVSLTDIGKKGILGGENSEARKLANSIAGGENSEFRKALREVDKVLNPARWKVDAKVDVKIGSSNGNPPKLELGTFGGKRVCIPWC